MLFARATEFESFRSRAPCRRIICEVGCAELVRLGYVPHMDLAQCWRATVSSPAPQPIALPRLEEAFAEILDARDLLLARRIRLQLSGWKV